jgi:hypothetical protein
MDRWFESNTAHQMIERCFACGKKLGKSPALVDTRDAQLVFVGSECLKKVLAAGENGWQPPRGGPRLFPLSKEQK